jgi:pimeloyl-ACP methyl ester carboxylesterase
MSSLPVTRVGHGPPLVLVHGSATDRTTWSIQLASKALRERFELIAYDRRTVATLGEAADDLAQIVGDTPALIVGSSFGSVVALELARSRRAPCAGLVMIEPPIAASDEPPDVMASAQASFGAEPTTLPTSREFFTLFDRTVVEAGGPAAGELFLRTVLGPAAFAKIPRAFLERSVARWAEIRADCVALLAYAPRYAELTALDVPILLVGGEQSAPYFRTTLDALAAALPRARRATVPRAGHMLHAEAASKFGQLVIEFAEEIGYLAEE